MNGKDDITPIFPFVFYFLGSITASISSIFESLNWKWALTLIISILIYVLFCMWYAFEINKFANVATGEEVKE